MKNDYTILSLCLHLEVSPSGYYDWQKRRVCPGARALEDQLLAKVIDQIHTRSRRTYGRPRVVEELRKQGRHHGRNRISRRTDLPLLSASKSPAVCSRKAF